MIRSLAIATLLATTGTGLTQDLASHDNRFDLMRWDAPDPAKLAVGVQTLDVVNPNQLDIMNVTGPDAMPRHDRPLTPEVWYPAAQSFESVFIGDGTRKVTLYDAALRAAAPDAAGGPYPLILISHGYPMKLAASFSRVWIGIRPIVPAGAVRKGSKSCVPSDTQSALARFGPTRDQMVRHQPHEGHRKP